MILNVAVYCMKFDPDYIHHVSTLWNSEHSGPTRGSSFCLGRVTAFGVLCCFALLFV